jgi:hypothetical protein
LTPPPDGPEVYPSTADRGHEVAIVLIDGRELLDLAGEHEAFDNDRNNRLFGQHRTDVDEVEVGQRDLIDTDNWYAHAELVAQHLPDDPGEVSVEDDDERIRCAE